MTNCRQLQLGETNYKHVHYFLKGKTPKFHYLFYKAWDSHGRSIQENAGEIQSKRDSNPQRNSVMGILLKGKPLLRSFWFLSKASKGTVSFWESDILNQENWEICIQNILEEIVRIEVK